MHKRDIMLVYRQTNIFAALPILYIISKKNLRESTVTAAFCSVVHAATSNFTALNALRRFEDRHD